MSEVGKFLSVKTLFTTGKTRFNLMKLLSLGLGLLLISWLLSQLDVSTAVEILREVPVSLVFLGFLCYAASFSLRALRFKLLLPPQSSKMHLFPIVLVHYTALNIIPARLGELSYVFLLKKVHQIPTASSLSSLVLARVFDQVAISVLFLVSAYFVELPSQWLTVLTLSIAGILFSTVIILLLLFRYKERCLEWVNRLVKHFNWDRHQIVPRVLEKLQEVTTALNRVQTTKNTAKVFGLSLAIWLNIFMVNYVLVQAFQVPLTYIEIVLSSTAIILLTVLPLQLLSGFGIHETTWVVVALALGVPRSVAITSAFGTHIISIVYLAFFGAYGIYRLRQYFWSSQQPKQS